MRRVRGGAAGAERVTVRIVPRQVYLSPAYDPGSDADAVGTIAE
jgi:hypothetical protein